MKKNYKLSAKQIRCYGAYLREQERADSTFKNISMILLRCWPISGAGR